MYIFLDSAASGRRSCGGRLLRPRDLQLSGQTPGIVEFVHDNFADLTRFDES
jgi:hypothetical protein